MNIKNYILERIETNNFKLIKIKYDNKLPSFTRLPQEIFTKEIEKFKNLLKKLENKNIANFIFLLRVLDFRLWEYKNNWHYKKEKGFYGLVERLKELFKLKNLEEIKFKEFKKIISPKEDYSLAFLRYKLFKKSLQWLNKNYQGDFQNYFEENKKPTDFCFNLLQLEKFKDYHKNLYFLKPNQLLYYEYLLAQNLEKKFQKELEELTIFADYKLAQILINFNLIEIPEKYIIKIKKKIPLKNHSVLENELRAGSILLGEKLSQKFQIPSYKLDTYLWSLSHKIKMKIPHPRVKTIFY